MPTDGPPCTACASSCQHGTEGRCHWGPGEVATCRDMVQAPPNGGGGGGGGQCTGPDQVDPFTSISPDFAPGPGCNVLEGDPVICHASIGMLVQEAQNNGANFVM